MWSKLFDCCFISANCDTISNVSVELTIVSHAVFEEDLHEVVVVDGQGRWALVECLTEASDNHDAVRFTMLIAQVLD